MRTLFAAVLVFFTQWAFSGEIVQIDYDGFTVWVDCEKRGASAFMYIAAADAGNYKRRGSFHLDPNIPSRCQQTSTKTYVYPGAGYDRGHLVPANHLDHSQVAIAQSNYMTNILPQNKTLNRSAWLATEEIVECYRDIAPVKVMGGVIWGSDASNDHFIGSHGVETPDWFWKVLQQGDQVIAWLFPNSADAKRSRLDSFIVSVKEIENVAKITVAAPEDAKTVRPRESWPIPPNCDKS